MTAPAPAARRPQDPLPAPHPVLLHAAAEVLPASVQMRYPAAVAQTAEGPEKVPVPASAPLPAPGPAQRQPRLRG